MAVIVISDTHLSQKMRPRKFAYLQRIISNADLVIIAGDFWDGELCTFEEFVSSGWRRLFPLLRSKAAIYIYGNHDPKEMSDERVALFYVRQCR